MNIKRLTAKSDQSFMSKDCSNTNDWTGRMYAICFDLSIASLERYYPGNDYRNAYGDISRELGRHGFQGQQGSVYFGQKGSTSIHCVLAVQALAAKYDWFAKVVQDLRMLRIEENNDLMPAIGQLPLPLSAPGVAA